MSFKANNLENKVWKDWLRENKDFIERCNLPETILKSRSHWEDFLLHGYLDHHEDESNFNLENLSTELQTNLLDFLENELDVEEKESFIVFKLLSQTN